MYVFIVYFFLQISLQASQHELSTELVQKLDLYDRMLTMVDQLLRVHNALQVIALSVKTHRYQEAVLNLKCKMIVWLMGGGKGKT